MSHIRYSQGMAFAAVCAIVVFAIFLVVLIYRVARVLTTPGELMVVVAAAPLGILVADFNGGFVHWFSDTFFAEDSSLFGRGIIAPFREHHRDPLAITRHGFLECNATNCFLVTPLLVLGTWGIQPEVGDVWMLLAGSVLIFFSVAALLTNQFHKWAHASKLPPPVRWLQEHHFILSPALHARHHRGDHTRAFCVTTGWMNALLDATGFFRLSERVLKSLGLPQESDEVSS